MSLSSKYSQAPTRFPDLFTKIRDGQAPEQFTQQLLKDWGFKSSNDRAFIPILKELSFLSPDGKPTTRYHSYRNHSESKKIMADAIREAYSDIFLIKEHPSDADKEAIKGKFKSFHNASNSVANFMMRTFYELLKLSDLKSSKVKYKKENKESSVEDIAEKQHIDKINNSSNVKSLLPSVSGLHYNIQIHLPPTKDIEVYNAIFKSLKEHLIEK